MTYFILNLLQLSSFQVPMQGVHMKQLKKKKGRDALKVVFAVLLLHFIKHSYTSYICQRCYITSGSSLQALWSPKQSDVAASFRLIKIRDEAKRRLAASEPFCHVGNYHMSHPLTAGLLSRLIRLPGEILACVHGLVQRTKTTRKKTSSNFELSPVEINSLVHLARWPGHLVLRLSAGQEVKGELWFRRLNSSHPACRCTRAFVLHAKNKGLICKRQFPRHRCVLAQNKPLSCVYVEAADGPFRDIKIDMNMIEAHCTWSQPKGV